MSFSYSVLFVDICNGSFNSCSHGFHIGLKASREVFTSIVAPEFLDLLTKLCKNHLFKCFIYFFGIILPLERVCPGISCVLVDNNHEVFLWSIELHFLQVAVYSFSQGRRLLDWLT